MGVGIREEERPAFGMVQFRRRRRSRHGFRRLVDGSGARTPAKVAGRGKRNLEFRIIVGRFHRPRRDDGGTGGRCGGRRGGRACDGVNPAGSRFREGGANRRFALGHMIQLGSLNR